MGIAAFLVRKNSLLQFLIDTPFMPMIVLIYGI